MAEVMEDAKSEARQDGHVLDNRGVWERCGMPMMVHDTQVVEFITKQRLEFVDTTTVNRLGAWSKPIHNPPCND